jgi:hypothetical protein
MRSLILITILLSSLAFADQNQRLANIVDTFSHSPASLSGDLTIASSLTLGSDNVNIGPMSARAAIEWRGYAPIGFRLTENEITINTSRAFYLNVASITLRINSISYNRNGRFQVSMDSPLMERSLETRLAAALEGKFKTKMDLALQQLSAIRRQRNGRDAQAVIDRVLEIFKGPPRSGLSLANVQMSGNVALNFDFPTAQTLAVSEDYVVDINAQDTLSAQGRFTRTNGRYNVSEIAFRSRQGVRFRA